jgi:peptidoglycan/LPS O-acetylase OafA/YrhL
MGALVIFLPHALAFRPLQATIILTLIPIFFGSLVALISLWEDCYRPCFWPLAWGLGLWLGRVSYSVYLFHLLIIYFVFPNAVLSDLPYYLLTLGVICTMTFYLFEKPLLDLRPQYRARTPTAPSNPQ